MSVKTKSIKIDVDYFQTELLHWYHTHKRSMPWREDPTPYHVWISEIMLQQTRVEAVFDYYLRFIHALPDIESLAMVDEDVLHKLWQGLGYYNRAKNLKKTAQRLVSEYQGRLPSTYEELIQLHGIGPYTAGAIASIAFSQKVVAVDGNVMRVIARITGDYRDIMQQATKKEMEKLVYDLLPDKDVSSFNQALMELGALLCIPNGTAKCNLCPVSKVCYAYKENRQDELPVKKAKKARRIEKRTVFIMMNGDQEYYIQKRKKHSLLSNLWEFPSIDKHVSLHDLKEILKEFGIRYNKIVKIESAKHIFSHIEWHMQGYFVQVVSNEPQISSNNQEDPFEEEYTWATKDSLEKHYSIPTAFKAYVDSIEHGDIYFLIRNNK